MRTSDNEKDPSATFWGDAGKGAIRIRCGACGTIFVDRSEVGEPTVCPFCHTENFYRSWFEW